MLIKGTHRLSDIQAAWFRAKSSPLYLSIHSPTQLWVFFLSDSTAGSGNGTHAKCMHSDSRKDKNMRTIRYVRKYNCGMYLDYNVMLNLITLWNQLGTPNKFVTQTTPQNTQACVFVLFSLGRRSRHMEELEKVKQSKVIKFRVQKLNYRIRNII